MTRMLKIKHLPKYFARSDQLHPWASLKYLIFYEICFVLIFLIECMLLVTIITSFRSYIAKYVCIAHCMQFSSFFFKIYPNSEKSPFWMRSSMFRHKIKQNGKNPMLTLFRIFIFLKIISLSLIYMILSNADLLHRRCHLAQVVWTVWLLSAKALGRLCVQKGRWRSYIFYFTSFILRNWNLTNV